MTSSNIRKLKCSMITLRPMTHYSFKLKQVSTRYHNLFLVIFLLIGLSPTSLAQNTNLRAHSGIAKTFAPLTTDPVVLLKPGYFIDPLYDPSSSNQAYMSAGELNRLLKPSLIFTATPKDLGNVYSNILTQEQWALVPLLPGQVTERNGLHGVLYKDDGAPTAGYQDYLSKKKTFEDIDEIYRNTPEGQRTPELEDKYRRAEDALNIVGRWEPKHNRYEQLNEEASLLWRDVDIKNLEQFRSSSSSGNGFLLTETSPTFDAEITTWTTIRVSAVELRQTDPLAKFANGVEAAALRWWYWSNPTDVDTSVCGSDIEDSDFTIQFDIAIAIVKRPWMDAKVFDSRAWRWRSGSNELLSDGRDEQNQGTAPLFPHSVLLVRSVILSGPGLLPCLPYVRKAIAARHEVGFGPFRVTGPSLSPSSYYLPPIITKNAIHVLYPQVLGYGVNMLPKTPNSNPAFVWP
jgi:hypothetical protein